MVVSPEAVPLSHYTVVASVCRGSRSIGLHVRAFLPNGGSECHERHRIPANGLTPVEGLAPHMHAQGALGL